MTTDNKLNFIVYYLAVIFSIFLPHLFQVTEGPQGRTFRNRCGRFCRTEVIAVAQQAASKYWRNINVKDCLKVKKKKSDSKIIAVSSLFKACVFTNIGRVVRSMINRHVTWGAVTWLQRVTTQTGWQPGWRQKSVDAGRLLASQRDRRSTSPRCETQLTRRRRTPSWTSTHRLDEHCTPTDDDDARRLTAKNKQVEITGASEILLANILLLCKT